MEKARPTESLNVSLVFHKSIITAATAAIAAITGSDGNEILPSAVARLCVMEVAILPDISFPIPVNLKKLNTAINAVSNGASCISPPSNSNPAFIASHNAVANFPAISRKSSSARNVPIFCPICSKSVSCNNAVTVVNAPFIQTFIVSASFSGLNSKKNLFIPSAIEFPRFSNLNSCPKSKAN